MSKNLFFVIGAPGSGKTTVAESIANQFNDILVHYSTGDLLREEVSNGSSLGKKIENFINMGELCPLDIIIDTIESAINSSDYNNVIIDGFPRSEEQMLEFNKVLDNKNILLKAVLEIKVSKGTAQDRILGRSRGEDDNIKVFQKRMDIYESSLDEIKSFYKDILITISGENSIKDVVLDAKNKIENKFNK